MVAIVDINVALIVGVVVVAALPIIRLVRLAATVAYMLYWLLFYNPSSGAVGVAVDAAVIFLADDDFLWNAVVRSLLRNSNVL